MGSRQNCKSPFPPDDQRVWYHLVLTTYGAWLYGDPRGFRTRHHREHVEGDYRNPPPKGMYDRLERKSRQSLKQPPVVFPAELREVVGRAMIERLLKLGGFVLSAAVAGQHVHIQVKMTKGAARWFGGLSKKHATYVLRDHGWKGKVWGKRGKAKRIRNRRHHRSVYEYILRHEQEGAWVWDWKRDSEIAPA